MMFTYVRSGCWWYVDRLNLLTNNPNSSLSSMKVLTKYSVALSDNICGSNWCLVNYIRCSKVGRVGCLQANTLKLHYLYFKLK